MWGFYGQLARRVPRLLWDSTDRYFKGLTALVFVLTLVNQPLGEQFVSAWEGISPFWALIPVGLLFVYGLMKANYEAFQKIEAEHDQLQTEKQTEEHRAVIGNGLANLYTKGVNLKTGVVQSDDASPVSVWKERLSEWCDEVYDYLIENVSLSQAQYVNSVTSVTAAMIQGMRSRVTRDGKETIVLQLEERLKRLAEVMRDY